MRRQKKPARKQIPKKALIKKRLLLVYGPVCWYCGIDLINQHIHIDHIKPIRLGGGDEIENLSLCCKFCNFAKWYSYLDEFFNWQDHIRSDKFKRRMKIEDDIHPTSSLYNKQEY